MKTTLKLLSIIIAIALFLTSCNKSGNYPLNGEGDTRLTPDSDKIVVFENEMPFGYWARNDRGNGNPFNCSFSLENVKINNGTMTLCLTEGGYRGFTGAEFRSWEKFSYGYYSVYMKAAACPGVISSFFTYTNHPWDEIDIEFLGDDTTKVQFNYYTNGIGGHEYVYDLGFDAAEDFHEYGFDWREDSITWYVDGKAVYKATNNVPRHSGHIMMNLWNVADTNADWAGRFDASLLPVYAEYQWIGYQKA